MRERERERERNNYSWLKAKRSKTLAWFLGNSIQIQGRRHKYSKQSNKQTNRNHEYEYVWTKAAKTRTRTCMQQKWQILSNKPKTTDIKHKEWECTMWDFADIALHSSFTINQQLTTYNNKHSLKQASSQLKECNTLML